MRCRKCGTEIADKAIVCYRCGTPAMETPAPARPPVRRRGVLPGLLLIVVTLVLVVASGTHGAAGIAEIVLGLLGLALVALALRRR